jgi:hypothetical protein
MSQPPSVSPPGSSPDGPGRLVHPSAAGHLWSPLDGVGKHLSWSSDQPVLKCRSGGQRGSTSGCSSRRIQCQSCRHACGYHYWVATDSVGSGPESRSICQFQGFPLPGRPVVPFGLHLLHQMLLDGVVLSGQRALSLAFVLCPWRHSYPRAGEGRGDSTRVGKHLFLRSSVDIKRGWFSS